MAVIMGCSKLAAPAGFRHGAGADGRATNQAARTIGKAYPAVNRNSLIFGKISARILSISCVSTRQSAII